MTNAYMTTKVKPEEKGFSNAVKDEDEPTTTHKKDKESGEFDQSYPEDFENSTPHESASKMGGSAELVKPIK